MSASAVDDNVWPGLLPAIATKVGGRVYLPPGEWVDYQTSERHAGERWRRIKGGPIPVVPLVRNHAAVPHVHAAQGTADIDWRNVEPRVFSTDDAPADGLFAPADGVVVQTPNLKGSAGAYALQADPLRGRVNRRVTRFPVR